jgi:DNA (cytosine-5)-methyltransferase 1
MKAIEFFSGIGGFAQAAALLSTDVIAAYDQDADANRAYRLNYGLQPQLRNLDSIKQSEILEADLWWMSPPCTPYTVRGAQRDSCDPRAKSILNLIDLIPKIKPRALLVENVMGFAQSIVLARLKERLLENGYRTWQMELCPTQFGIPMKRPRLFFCALLSGEADLQKTASRIMARLLTTPQMVPLAEFTSDDGNEDLIVSDEILKKHWPGLNVVDQSSLIDRTICFTSSYAKSFKASGSLLRTSQGKIRRFSPAEILRLMGFAPSFKLPADISLSKRWKLVGNSVDVRCASLALNVMQTAINFEIDLDLNLKPSMGKDQIELGRMAPMRQR